MCACVRTRAFGACLRPVGRPMFPPAAGTPARAGCGTLLCVRAEGHLGRRGPCAPRPRGALLPTPLAAQQPIPLVLRGAGLPGSKGRLPARPAKGAPAARRGRAPLAALAAGGRAESLLPTCYSPGPLAGLRRRGAAPGCWARARGAIALLSTVCPTRGPCIPRSRRGCQHTPLRPLPRLMAPHVQYYTIQYLTPPHTLPAAPLAANGIMIPRAQCAVDRGRAPRGPQLPCSTAPLQLVISPLLRPACIAGGRPRPAARPVALPVLRNLLRPAP